MDIEAGIQKHKGIGFVEFNTHEEAMTALRAMNNNPEVFSKQKRPIVEFAVEDARAVKNWKRGSPIASYERNVIIRVATTTTSVNQT